MNISGDELRMKKVIMETIQENPVKEETTEESHPKDIKLGEIQLKETSVLVIKKTNYKGQDRVDFRVWLNSLKYKGPTKQGFALSMDKVDEFINIVKGMKEKMENH